MGTDALLVTLEQRPVTSFTVGGSVGVTQQLTPALGCTPVTFVTGANDATAARDRDGDFVRA